MAGRSSLKSSRRRRGWRTVLVLVIIAALGAFAVLRWWPAPQTATPDWAITPKPIRVPAQLRPADAVPAERGEYAGGNLLLVTFDTTRADRIGCYGNDDIATPALDALAQRGVLFSRAVAPAPVTLPSHASILTGLYPYRHGARTNGHSRLGDEHLTLPEILADEGYATAAMVSAVVLGSQFGIDQGFQVYDDEMEESSEKRLRMMAQRTADATTRQALLWLRLHADDRFFLWVHYYDPHYPYEAPPPYDAMYERAYDGEIAFADSQLAVLLARVEALGLTDRTLVVMAADHGEGLGQHLEATHGAQAYDSTMHVPLLMSCGDRLGGGLHVSRPASLVDIMPTVLTMLGLPTPEGLDGIDLTQPPAGDRPIYVETLEAMVLNGWAPQLGVYEGTSKYIFCAEQAELYDLGRDPFEQRDIVSRRPDEAAALHRRLVEFFGDDLEEAATARQDHAVDAEVLAKLRALGYVGGDTAEIPPPDRRPHPRDVLPLMRRTFGAIDLYGSEGIDAVVARLEELVAENPEFIAGHKHLGNMYVRAGDFEAAAREYVRCLELRPGQDLVLLDLARVKIRQGLIDEAVEVYRQVLDQMPENFAGLSELSRALRMQGEHTRAAEVITDALEVRPRDRALPDMLVSSLAMDGRQGEAISLFRRHLEAEPNLAAMRNALAGLLVDAEQFAEAIDVLTLGIELEPNQFELINNLAFLLAECPELGLRNPQEAARLMEDVNRKTDEQDPRYLFTLSAIYAHQLRFDEAIDKAEKARKLASGSRNPKHAQLARTIGMSIAAYRQLKAKMTEAAPAGEGAGS